MFPDMHSLLLRDFRVRWVDFLLGSLLIAIVIAALLLQRSISASAEKQIHELAHHLGKNMLVLPSAMNVADFYRGRYGSSGMPADSASRLTSSPLATHIREATSLLYGNLDESGSLVIVGMDPWGGPDDSSVLGTAASRQLNATVDGSFRANGMPLQVTQVIQSPPDGLDRGIFTSLLTAQRIMDRPHDINALRLGGCWCRIDVQTLAKEVEKVLPDTQAITVAGMVKAQKGSVAVMEQYSLALHLAGAAIVLGTIAVLISAQVRRSLPELGLLLAMGASPTMVSSLFVLKAGLMGAFGAGLGLLLGIAVVTPIGSLLLGMPLQASPALGESFLPLAFLSVLLSMAAACVPAWRAAQLDPAEVLRND